MLKLTQTVLFNLKATPKPFPFLHKLFKSTKVDPKPEDPSPKNRMVAAVFASLNTEIQTPITDDKIRKASNVNELLSISEGSGISRRHALKVVSTLAEWSSSGKTQIADFENDTRFIKLCRILSKGAKINRNMAARSEDLSTILGVTADEEAARLIGGLSLTQMVKVMSSLAGKKRRSVVLLRTLAYNLSANNDRLDLKQSADLLYSMCLLNFIDENLLSKTSDDIILQLNNSVDLQKGTVIGSIITSLGLLKYKHTELLDALSHWMLNNQSICRIQDLFSLFFTLANVNYQPANHEMLFTKLIPFLNQSEAAKPSIWLSFIWSLVVLNQASHDHISSVLSNEFVSKFDSFDNYSAKLKLLNIDGAARILMNCQNLLDTNSKLHDFAIIKTKEKTKLVENVLDTLKNLLMESHLKIDVNSGMGFNIDAECLFDKKGNSLPFNKGWECKPETVRVALLVFDYHDMCLGKIEPSGLNVLIMRLLEAQNYKVLTVPYNEFKMSDKLVHRVQYLESKLKNLLKL